MSKTALKAFAQGFVEGYSARRSNSIDTVEGVWALLAALVFAV